MIVSELMLLSIILNKISTIRTVLTNRHTSILKVDFEDYDSFSFVYPTDQHFQLGLSIDYIVW